MKDASARSVGLPAAIGLSEEVLSTVRCPICRSAVMFNTDCIRCLSPKCGTLFPVVRGIPVLLNEGNSIFRIAEAFPEPRSSSKQRLAQFADRVIPQLGKNHSAKRNLSRMADLLAADSERPRILEIGAGLLDESLLLLTERPGFEVIFSDVAVAPDPSFQHYRDPGASNVSIVCDGHDLPFADGSFDGAVVIAVLEHVLDPYRVASEITRVVRPGGIVYAETPFMQQVHGGAYDFTRFTELGHRRLFRWFQEIDCGPVAGAGTALAWSWSYFLRSLTSTPRSYTLAKVLGRVTAWWLHHADRITMNTRGGRGSASGYYFLGRRSDSPISDAQLIASYRGL